jgi:hypothetical protein
MPRMERTIWLTLSVKVPATDQATDNDVARTISDAIQSVGRLGEPEPWGEWIVGQVRAVPQV